MKKRNLFLVTSLFTVATLGLSTVIIGNNNLVAYRNTQADDSGTITLNKDTRTENFSNKYIRTANGNAISITTNATAGSGDYWSSFTNGQYLCNTGAVNGIASIKVTYSGGSLTLKYGATSANLSDIATLSSGVAYTNFSTYHPPYFGLFNEGNSIVNISSVEIVFSCTTSSINTALKIPGGYNQPIGEVYHATKGDSADIIGFEFDILEMSITGGEWFAFLPDFTTNFGSYNSGNGVAFLMRNEHNPVSFASQGFNTYMSTNTWKSYVQTTSVQEPVEHVIAAGAEDAFWFEFTEYFANLYKPMHVTFMFILSENAVKLDFYDKSVEKPLHSTYSIPLALSLDASKYYYMSLSTLAMYSTASDYMVIDNLRYVNYTTETVISQTDFDDASEICYGWNTSAGKFDAAICVNTTHSEFVHYVS